MDRTALTPLTPLSPKATARLAGILYFLTMIAGGVAQGAIAERLQVPGDAAATAANFVAHQALVRAGLALYLVEMACQIAMTVLLFDLLRPVSRRVAVLSLAYGLTGCGVKIVARIFFAAPLLVLGGSGVGGAFGPEQADGLVRLLLRMNHQAEAIAVVFFGLHAVLQGYLIARSGFLPRALGVIAVAGGLGWLTYLYEPFAARIVPAILGVAVIGSVALAGWLVVAGVNEERWRARAGTGAA